MNQYDAKETNKVGKRGYPSLGTFLGYFASFFPPHILNFSTFWRVSRNQPDELLRHRTQASRRQGQVITNGLHCDNGTTV